MWSRIKCVLNIKYVMFAKKWKTRKYTSFQILDFWLLEIKINVKIIKNNILTLSNTHRTKFESNNRFWDFHNFDQTDKNADFQIFVFSSYGAENERKTT